MPGPLEMRPDYSYKLRKENTMKIDSCTKSFNNKKHKIECDILGGQLAKNYAQAMAKRDMRDHRTKTRRRISLAETSNMSIEPQANRPHIKLHKPTKASFLLLIITTIFVTLISSTQGSQNQQYIDGRNNNAIQCK